MNKKQFRKIILFLGILVVALLAYLLFNRLAPQTVWKSDDVGALTNSSTPYVYFSQLDGIGVSSKTEEIPAVVAIMIENHPDARAQQSGMDRANIVYEVPVEGGITRFFAVFDKNQTAEKVGPVRSARPYFLDWLREYCDALYMHSGGSPDALAKIKSDGIFDANEFWWGSYYWRDNNFDAPHNLFTSSAQWQKIFADYGGNHLSVGWVGWKFNTTSADFSGTDISAIKIKYNAYYIIEWKYDPVVKNFIRFLNGEQYKTVDGSAVTANTVAVQTVTQKILDEVGRLELGTIGNGEARVLRGGKMTSGSWKKDNASGRTLFLDENGQEIEFMPGKIWVQIVPRATEIEITKV